MKTTILTLNLILLIVFTAFAQQSNTDRDIKMYAEVWDDIVNQNNIDAINETHFSKDILLISEQGNIAGIADFKEYYKEFLAGFSDVEFTIVDIFGQGDKIVKHWNFKGRHTGDLFGMPATGKTVDIDGVTLVKMREGKIAQEQDFIDNAMFMRQLGLISEPGNVAVIDAMYQSFAQGDIPAVLAAMHSDIVWNEAEGNALAAGNPYIGPDAVLNGVFMSLGRDYDYFKLTGIELHEMSGNQVLATLRYKAKVKNNEALLDVQAAHLWTLKNGKVTAFQQYADTKQLDDALNK